jgi:hypothetical protein
VQCVLAFLPTPSVLVLGFIENLSVAVSETGPLLGLFLDGYRAMNMSLADQIKTEMKKD